MHRIWWALVVGFELVWMLPTVHAQSVSPLPAGIEQELVRLEGHLQALEARAARQPALKKQLGPELEGARASLTRLRAALSLPASVIPHAPLPAPAPEANALPAAPAPATAPLPRAVMVVSPPSAGGAVVVVNTEGPQSASSQPSGTVLPPPIQENDLRTLLDAIAAESFGQGRLRVLETAAPHYTFHALQAKQLLEVFSFEQERLKALELLAPRLIDRQNAYLLYGAFDFQSSRDQAERILR